MFKFVCSSFLFLFGALHALDNLSNGGAPTVYYQWLADSSDPMTLADGDGTVSLSAYGGGALTQMLNPGTQDLYLGVMCNRKTGYDIMLTGSSAGPASNQVRLSLLGSADLIFTLTISPVAGTFHAGATTLTSIDTSGSTASGTATFQNPSQTPKDTTAPNVWRITVDTESISSPADGLVTAGSYSGSLTATVVLK